MTLLQPLWAHVFSFHIKFEGRLSFPVLSHTAGGREVDNFDTGGMCIRERQEHGADVQSKCNHKLIVRAPSSQASDESDNKRQLRQNNVQIEGTEDWSFVSVTTNQPNSNRRACFCHSTSQFRRLGVWWHGYGFNITHRGVRKSGRLFAEHPLCWAANAKGAPEWNLWNVQLEHCLVKWPKLVPVETAMSRFHLTHAY